MLGKYPTFTQLYPHSVIRLSTLVLDSLWTLGRLWNCHPPVLACWVAGITSVPLGLTYTVLLCSRRKGSIIDRGEEKLTKGTKITWECFQSEQLLIKHFCGFKKKHSFSTNMNHIYLESHSQVRIYLPLESSTMQLIVVMGQKHMLSLSEVSFKAEHTHPCTVFSSWLTSCLSPVSPTNWRTTLVTFPSYMNFTTTGSIKDSYKLLHAYIIQAQFSHHYSKNNTVQNYLHISISNLEMGQSTQDG